MTPKEKANDLIKNMEFEIPYIHDPTEPQPNNIAKQCALIAVDEIDDIYQKLTPKDDPYYFLLELEYWQQVKQEINGI